MTNMGFQFSNKLKRVNFFYSSFKFEIPSINKIYSCLLRSKLNHTNLLQLCVKDVGQGHQNSKFNERS